MSVTRKLFDAALLIMFILAFLPGCEDKRAPQTTRPAAAVPATPDVEEEEAIDPQAALEVACYEGDQDACDQLGH